MNILVLTSVYPDLDDKNENVTKVVKYFANNWAAQGNNVKVIHNAHKYLSIVHLLPHRIKNFIASKISFYIPDIEKVREKTFFDGKVEVYRIPIVKYIPHGNHTKLSIKKQVRKIESKLKKEKFNPDVIIGHWVSPQIQIIKELKKIYKCNTALVLHGRDYLDGKKIKLEEYLEFVDKIGCRSITEAKYVKKVLNLKEQPFVCYSGVPDNFVEKYKFDASKFEKKPKVWKFIYVGRLVEYKKVDKVLIALSKIKNKNFIFDIIGTGSQEKYLKKLAKDLKIEEKVIFHGRMPREEVLKYMKDAHFFVMISIGEVFGLVYLEAMVTSCICIGSKKEGIDGVIENNKNGFLCEAGNENDLEQIINKLMIQTPSILKEIARKSYETAVQHTDSNVSTWYLNNVINIK